MAMLLNICPTQGGSQVSFDRENSAELRLWGGLASALMSDTYGLTSCRDVIVLIREHVRFSSTTLIGQRNLLGMVIK
jgi:hypothetical protein